MADKTPAPRLSRDEFVAKAPQMILKLYAPDGVTVIAETLIEPREFSTGSFGWAGQIRAAIPVKDNAGTVHLLKSTGGFNFTVSASKDAPREAAAATPVATGNNVVQGS